MSDAPGIAERLEAVRARVADACRAAGRDEASVRIVAVTKKVGADAIVAAYRAGQRDFGENYVQEATGKIAALAGAMPDARWHFIGRLQSNKAAVAVRSFALLHGVDSHSTVEALARAAEREGRTIDALVQIRLGAGTHGETDTLRTRTARGGVEADAARELLENAAAHRGVRFVGLMGVADPDLPARPQFAELRRLSDALRTETDAPLVELSMGMTGDFADAIAEGATIVRIGTAIFGERPRG